jgi:hypothetical protein
MLSGPSSRIPSGFVGWYATFVPAEAGQVQCRRASRAGIARCACAWLRAETPSFRGQCRLRAASPREDRVLRVRFGIGMNTDHTKVLRKLKHPSMSRKSRSFLDN